MAYYKLAYYKLEYTSVNVLFAIYVFNVDSFISICHTVIFAYFSNIVSSFRLLIKLCRIWKFSMIFRLENLERALGILSINCYNCHLAGKHWMNSPFHLQSQQQFLFSFEMTFLLKDTKVLNTAVLLRAIFAGYVAFILVIYWFFIGYFVCLHSL